MSDPAHFFLCSTCLREHGRQVVVRAVEVGHVEVASGEAVASWEWRCPECETVCGVVIDYGTIDLGLVTDEQLARAAEENDPFNVRLPE